MKKSNNNGVKKICKIPLNPLRTFRDSDSLCPTNRWDL